MSSPRSQTSVYEQPSAARGFNEPLSYSITVSCLGHLIRDGHQLSHHFHREDQQSFTLPVNTSQSSVWTAYCPQAHLKSLVRPNNGDSDTYWQTLKSQLKLQLVMKHKVLLNNLSIKRKDVSIVVSLMRTCKWVNLSLLSYISKSSQVT